jgi:hypothetical protein
MNNRYANNLIQTPQVKQQFQVDLTTADKQACECGNDTFVQAVQIFIVSPFMSPNGQELVATPPCVACTKCGKPYERKP